MIWFALGVFVGAAGLAAALVILTSHDHNFGAGLNDPPRE